MTNTKTKQKHPLLYHDSSDSSDSSDSDEQEEKAEIENKTSSNHLKLTTKEIWTIVIIIVVIISMLIIGIIVLRNINKKSQIEANLELQQLTGNQANYAKSTWYDTQPWNEPLVGDI